MKWCRIRSGGMYFTVSLPRRDLTAYCIRMSRPTTQTIPHPFNGRLNLHQGVKAEVWFRIFDNDTPLPLLLDIRHIYAWRRHVPFPLAVPPGAKAIRFGKPCIQRTKPSCRSHLSVQGRFPCMQIYFANSAIYGCRLRFGKILFSPITMCLLHRHCKGYESYKLKTHLPMYSINRQSQQTVRTIPLI